MELLIIESQDELKGLEDVKWDSISEYDLDPDLSCLCEIMEQALCIY